MRGQLLLARLVPVAQKSVPYLDRESFSRKISTDKHPKRQVREKSRCAPSRLCLSHDEVFKDRRRRSHRVELDFWGHVVALV
jgi:hypothetical protein